jgi:hypothetical protein
MLSIIIPSRTERFLQKTILDILEKATGDIEVLPVLDGYDPPQNEIVVDPRVKYIRMPQVRELQKRQCVVRAVEESKGEYIMSVDAHCMFDKGFDTILLKDHQPDWVTIPRRNRLDPINWSLQPQGDKRPPIDYEYLMYPFRKGGDHGFGGFRWDARTFERWNIPIDDTMEFQGSCWLMTKDWFNKNNFFKDMGYTGWGQEAEEIGFTTWLRGGRVVTNKNTWYAHLHKGATFGRMYFMDKKDNHRCYEYSYKFWMNDRLPNRVHDFEWYINKFMPIPGWRADWKEVLKPTYL